ncbi:MAG: ATP synthase F0 subunit C [Deltaproteobacteria bacterium]
MVLAVIFLTAGFGVVLGAVVPAIAQGKAVKAACEGMARNPGIAGQLMTTMLLGLAMIEALAIYPFVVALILLFIFAGKFI